MLKSRSTRPPGGWKFTQPQTGWSLKPGFTFNDAVAQIIAHRQQNPRFNLPTDFDAVANELDLYTCQILKNSPVWCIDASPPTFTIPLPVYRRPEGRGTMALIKGSVAAGSKFISNTSAGIRLWIDWFGNGKLVEKDKAEQRAKVCVSCPLNQAANIAERFSAAAAKEIMAIFASLHDMEMQTQYDNNLNICSACDCPLKAKIWTPIDILKRHITDQAMASLDKRCWILAESKT